MEPQPFRSYRRSIRMKSATKAVADLASSNPSAMQSWIHDPLFKYLVGHQ